MRGSMTDRPAPAQIERILAVRVGRGGDLVMLTPALRLLLDAFPSATVDLWTGPDGPRVLEGFDARLARFLVETRRFPASWLARRKLAHEVRGGYDRAYVFETSVRWAALARDAAPSVDVLPAASPREHFADRCLDLVEHSLPVALHRPWASLPVDDAARQRADAYLKEHGVDERETLVGLHLTYSGTARGPFAAARDRKHRRWPLENAASLAQLLKAQRPDVRIVVDALPKEVDGLAPFFENAEATLLQGPPDFARYKAVLARLTALVTPNTGPMHFAAAVGTPVVALFSGWKASECGPFAPPGRAVIVRAEDAPRGEGLAAIEPEAILDALMPLL